MLTTTLNKTLKLSLAAVFALTLIGASSVQAGDTVPGSYPRVYSNGWHVLRDNANRGKHIGNGAVAATPRRASDPRPYSEGWHAMRNSAAAANRGAATASVAAPSSTVVANPTTYVATRRASDPRVYSNGWHAMRDHGLING